MNPLFLLWLPVEPDPTWCSLPPPPGWQPFFFHGGEGTLDIHIRFWSQEPRWHHAPFWTLLGMVKLMTIPSCTTTSLTMAQHESLHHTHTHYTPHITHTYINAHAQFSSVTQSCPILQPHGLQHARLPCPSPTPGVYSNSHPLSP